MSGVNSDLLRALPPHLGERTRSVGSDKSNPGEFVLYWLHHAMRAAENPALDVAVTCAERLRLPLLVYQAIPERTPYASDRHHLFMLEGARDVQQQFQARGIPYALHLERRGHRGGHLTDLCQRSAVVVTEDLPVEPMRSWTEGLASATATPVLCVDTACVAPMQLVGQAFTRAFEFRRATEALYEERTVRPWPDVPLTPGGEIGELPFEPLSLQDYDLAQLVGECDIDHSIAPVAETRGGSAAGYRRWDAFRQQGLAQYARQRNDPLAAGTSRLSAYFHYGMISPLRVAREAAASGVPGAEKFLDELLIWREMAYAFCFYRREHESLAALPRWARDTLTAHQTDRRAVLHSWETLARAQTGDRLWDAAQRSLLLHGELHNNVRMTWGKALLNWTPDPQSALSAIIELNHRYALDGRDPASYGGILWCLGQFDRPFPPARPIFGTLRDRPTAQHAKRLDSESYARLTARPLCEPRPTVAVIGAGLSGLICARTLHDHGLDVTVFEKSRGVGGRMATRRTTEGPAFDHGAQYFTVRDERFERYVNSWIQDAVVAPWLGRIVTLTNGRVETKAQTTPRFVGRPGMSAVCRHLATDLNVRSRVQARPPERSGGLWHLSDQDGGDLGAFDYVITSAPAPQSAELLRAAPQLAHRAQATAMRGCWAAMVAFDEPVEVDFDGAFVHDSPLSWIARDSSKPGRGGSGECWVLHASAEWTATRIDANSEDVLPKLIDAFWQATAARRVRHRLGIAHRWRYAIPPEPLDSRSLFDPQLRIGACGDWCSGPRVEGAFLSGMSLAGQVLARVAVAD